MKLDTLMVHPWTSSHQNFSPQIYSIFHHDCILTHCPTEGWLKYTITSAPTAVLVPWKHSLVVQFHWGRMLAEKQTWQGSGSPGSTVTWKVVSRDAWWEKKIPEIKYICLPNFAEVDRPHSSFTQKHQLWNDKASRWVPEATKHQKVSFPHSGCSPQREPPTQEIMNYRRSDSLKSSLTWDTATISSFSFLPQIPLLSLNPHSNSFSTPVLGLFVKYLPGKLPAGVVLKLLFKSPGGQVEPPYLPNQDFCR